MITHHAFRVTYGAETLGVISMPIRKPSQTMLKGEASMQLGLPSYELAGASFRLVESNEIAAVVGGFLREMGRRELDRREHDAARDLNALAKLTDGQRAAVAELRSHCPAPGDYGAAWLQGDKVNEYRYLDPVSRDAYDGDHVAEFVATFVADIGGESDSVIVTVEGNVLTNRAHLIVTPEAIAAAGLKIAREAAESFTVDDEREDAESAAQRAADILRDLSADDVPTFLTRVFGLPVEEAHASREYRSITLHGNPAEDWNAYRELGRQAAIERGFPDVARELVCHYQDILVPLAFAGHEAQPGDFGDSTNLSMWKEAIAAFDAVNVVAHHTFGGYSLDGCQDRVNALAVITLDAAIAAVQYATLNAVNGDSEAFPIEPRAE